MALGLPLLLLAIRPASAYQLCADVFITIDLPEIVMNVGGQTITFPAGRSTPVQTCKETTAFGVVKAGRWIGDEKPCDDTIPPGNALQKSYYIRWVNPGMGSAQPAITCRIK
ncbi:hypothetical protein STAQ_04410 [Allostella sp. ATCC 35155]|nr:hypothetical protein STAQ_04410 [Stella sp. ATCC 35155]